MYRRGTPRLALFWMMKAQFDARVITVREITLANGKTVPAGTTDS
jgi:hypothetical protein